MDQSPCGGVGRQEKTTVIFDCECPKVVDRFRIGHGQSEHAYARFIL